MIPDSTAQCDIFACDFEVDTCGLETGSSYPAWLRRSSEDDVSTPNVDTIGYNHYMIFDSRNTMGEIAAR